MIVLYVYDYSITLYIMMDRNNYLKLKYNYVVCGSGGYYAIGYNDIMGHPQIKYHDNYLSGVDGFLMRSIVRLNFSRKINTLVKTPFSQIVNRCLFKNEFDRQSRICYLFFMNHNMIFNSSYPQYLRSIYPNVKIALYLQDLISSRSKHDLDMDYLKKVFDVILSYDKHDCERYGLIYHPTPMSVVNVPDNKSLSFSDVYYCGSAKGRYPLIHRIFEECQKQGLICDFNILENPRDPVKDKLDGVNYIHSPLSYIENLQHVVKTSCILEVMQEHAIGYTPRLWESIVYDKHLLSNNTEIVNSEYYKKGITHIFDDGFSFDLFRKDIETKVEYPALYKQKLSPIHLFQTIDNLF